MKRILYPIMLFIIIGQSAIAQCVNRYKQKIVLAYYKTIQCNSDMERNLSIKEEAKRHNNADSLSYISEDTLVLYKGNIETDTLFLNSPKGCVRGIYIYTDEGIVTLKGGYNLSNGILRKVNVDKNTYRILRQISDDYHPNADHSSHMAHYSSR